MLPHAFKKASWRQLAPSAKESLGMYDVRDPHKRAELCTSCHIGSPAEGKVITHTMYAAGHPPLPSFELATFSANLPPHWRAVKDVPYFKDAPASVKQDYHVDMARFENTRLVMAAALTAPRRTLEVLANRAHLDVQAAPSLQSKTAWPPLWFLSHVEATRDNPRARWPELAVGAPAATDLPADHWPEIVMAQADCYACHHELKSASWRQVRGYKGRPGRPQLQDWPFVLAALTLDKEPRTNFDRHRQAIHAAFDKQPFGDPKDVAKAAREFLAELPSTEDNVDDALALSWLKKLSAFDEKFYPDFDSARQIAAAFRAIYFDDWNAGHAKRAAVEKIMQALDETLNLTPRSRGRDAVTREREDLCARFFDRSMEKNVADSTGFLLSLQTLSNNDLAISLERVAAYDPVVFRNTMLQVAELVNGK